MALARTPITIATVNSTVNVEPRANVATMPAGLDTRSGCANKPVASVDATTRSVNAANKRSVNSSTTSFQFNQRGIKTSGPTPITRGFVELVTPLKQLKTGQRG
jgi:hypothetical protein